MESTPSELSAKGATLLHFRESAQGTMGPGVRHEML
jgi:hypothetical protein